MGRGRKTRNRQLKEKSEVSRTVNSSKTARNLTKKELGAVIFGCKNHTFTECLEKMLFGLPAGHYSYVKDVSPGLPLFLFNYSDRKLHGIFKATSCGKMNINPHAWITSEGSEYTPYPAQVQVGIRRECWPLHEEEFKPIIAKNYYSEKLFRFELDNEQTRRLTELFLSSKLPEKQLPRAPNAARRNKTLNVDKAQNEQFKNIDSKEYPGTAQMSLKENEHSYATIFANRDAFAPEKKWTELFKESSSSSLVKNSDVLVSDTEILNASASDHWDMDSKFTSSSQEMIKPHPEHCPDNVVGCWENHVSENSATHVQYPEQDSNRSDLRDVASSENTIFLDSEYGELKSLEFESVVATVPGQVLLGTKEKTSSGNALAHTETFERDHNQLNLMDVIIKLTQEVEELKVSQSKQALKIDSLQHQLVHSELEIDQLKRRCGELECVTSSASSHNSGLY